MRHLGLGLAFLLLLALPAKATSGSYVEIVCPVCRHVFEGWEWHSTNGFGGADADGCCHAIGWQVFLRYCWTCPACLYTGLQHEWLEDEARPVALIERLRLDNPLQARDRVDPTVTRTTDIPAGLRWDLYLQVLQLRQGTRAETLDALLQTAWTQRFDTPWPAALHDALCALEHTYGPLAYPGSPAVRDAWRDDLGMARRLKADAGDPALPLSDVERQQRLLLAAATWKSRGEDPDALRALDALEACDDDLPDAVVETVAELRRRVAWELRYLTQAVPLLRAELASGEISDEDRPWARLRLGELLRKTGAPREALEVFTELEEMALPDRLRVRLGDRISTTRCQLGLPPEVDPSTDTSETGPRLAPPR